MRLRGLATLSSGISNSGLISALRDIRVTAGETPFGAELPASTFYSGTITGNVGIVIGADVAFAGGSGIINSSNITGSGGVAIDASAATGALSIAQAAGTITGAIKLSAHADVLTVSGGAIGGNVIGQGSNDTVDFAPGSGNTIIYAHVISGVTTISLASGDLALGGGGSIAGNVTFTSASATLQLDAGVSQLGGAIAGAVTGDAIDLRFQAFTSGDQAIGRGPWRLRRHRYLGHDPAQQQYRRSSNSTTSATTTSPTLSR